MLSADSVQIVFLLFFNIMSKLSGSSFSLLSPPVFGVEGWDY